MLVVIKFNSLCTPVSHLRTQRLMLRITVILLDIYVGVKVGLTT
jgi:hypothetical protein